MNRHELALKHAEVAFELLDASKNFFSLESEEENLNEFET